MAPAAASTSETAAQFARQAEHLSLLPQGGNEEEVKAKTALRAVHITPADTVIELTNGDRLPAVPLSEAQKLNTLRAKAEGAGLGSGSAQERVERGHQEVQSSGQAFNGKPSEKSGVAEEHTVGEKDTVDASLSTATPPTSTNPLFPPLPLYGPPSFFRDLHCYFFRFTSFFLSLGFLAVIVLGSAFTSLPLMFRHIGMRLRLKNPSSRRPFFSKEEQRKKARNESQRQWRHSNKRRRGSLRAGVDNKEEDAGHTEEFVPTEGGPDPLVCDVGYYARRVGLDVEIYKVQTEDGFIIDMWHLYNPLEYTPATEEERGYHRPEVFPKDQANSDPQRPKPRGRRRYPVLMIHGLLQSAGKDLHHSYRQVGIADDLGAYCTNDDDSLAFFLAKRYTF